MGDALKTVVKGLSFLGVGVDANCVQVDVEEGKILRIRPFHFDWKYDREPWTIEARGKTFTASGKTLIPPFTLGYKNRVFSPNRVKYPLKRVDWDPSGAPGSTGPGGRNAQNRGRQRIRAHQLGRGRGTGRRRDTPRERAVRHGGRTRPGRRPR